MTLVAPSILAADFGRLAQEVDAVTAAGADWIHVDVMDGHFVPNISLGPDIVSVVNAATDLPLDVHLMIEEPQNYIAQFAKAGADFITVHEEVSRSDGQGGASDLESLFSMIEDAGARPGVAINPATSVDGVIELVERAALILVMSVVPGFGGQSFMPVALDKLDRLAKEKRKSGSDCYLEVDGGINVETAALAKKAGADVLVAGSSVFNADDYATAIETLR